MSASVLKWGPVLLALLCGLSGAGVQAAEPGDAAASAVSATAEASPQEQQRQAHVTALRAALDEARKVQVNGPAEVVLKDQAKLKLPEGYIWIPEPQASQVMKAWGNHPDEREIGLIFPKADDQEWVVVAEYEPSGYIKDDDAKNWNIDEMFKHYKEGTEAANEDRRKNGFPELDLIGWVEKPTYDAAQHRLIWSMSVRDKGAPAEAGQSVNYNTYALGREGYITLNMITELSTIEKEKGFAQQLIGSIEFTEGKRYADFNASTDHVAEYGLAALVGGLAAKKLGMFALAAGLFAKFAKVIAVAVLGLGAALRKVFAKKDGQDGQG